MHYSLTPQDVPSTPLRRRAVVTGVGAVSPAGVGTSGYWAGLQNAPIEPGPRHVDSELLDAELAALFDAKELRRSDRFTHLAVVAANEALQHAGLDAALTSEALDRTMCGVVVGTGIGGWTTIESVLGRAFQHGPRKIPPTTVPMMMPNAAAATLAIRYGLNGPCETIVTACASGTHAIGHATRLIENGICDVMLVGGAEAPLAEMCVAAFRNMTALSTSGWSRPFDQDRDGFVIAEGAAFMLMEDATHAARRHAVTLAEVAGFASTCDASHITQPDGAGAVRSMRQAIRSAGLTPADVTHVNAHGTSTPWNDRVEAAAIREVFGDALPLVTSLKGVNGHSLGASGALEAVGVVLGMAHQMIPPTAGTSNVDSEIELDVVLDVARPWTPAPVLSNSFAFGGHNASVVLTPPAD